MKKLIFIFYFVFSLSSLSNASHNCILELSDGNKLDLRDLTNPICNKGQVFDKNHCGCKPKITQKDKNNKFVDWRDFYDFIVDDESPDYTYLNALSFELLDLNIISEKELNKILSYKRKTTDTLSGARLICGDKPFIIDREDIEMIGIEFRARNKFIGYGIEDGQWHDISGTYKKTLNEIELDYKILGTDIDKKTTEISRKDLTIYGSQCALFHPRINMKKIMKKIQESLLSSDENKL